MVKKIHLVNISMLALLCASSCVSLYDGSFYDWNSSSDDTSTDTTSSDTTSSDTTSSSINSSTSINSSSNNTSSSSSSTPIVEGKLNYYKGTPNYLATDLRKDQYVKSTGIQNVLVIPIYLSDGDFKGEDFNTEILNDYIFGDKEDTPYDWNSLKTYYETASYGQLKIEGEVAPIYYSSCSKDDFAGENYNSYTNLHNMYTDAVHWLKSEGFNLDDYDLDDNGYIDSSHFVVNTIGESNSALWPHFFQIQNERGTKASPNVLSYTQTAYDHFTSARTAIHEQGHMFGLEDYYDYAYKTNYVGCFDMQSHNVGDWNSFSKLCMGWNEPYVIDGSSNEKNDFIEINLKDSATSKDCILIPGEKSWNNSAYDEYILIELFSPKGNNKDDFYNWYGDLSYPGVKIYHVDARILDLYDEEEVTNPFNSIENDYLTLINNNNSEPVSGYPHYGDLEHKLLTLIQADKSTTFSKGMVYLESKHLFTPKQTFNISRYSASFPNGTKLNNGENFPYEVSFSNLSSDSVTVTITKIK